MNNKALSIPSTKHLLLTGRPGCGKTTVIRLVVEGRCDARGFYTGEIREGGKRTGFSITTLDGRKGLLAGVKVKSRIKVGRYWVNLKDIDELAASAIESAIKDKKVEVIVIDEIASMEIASERFKDAVISALKSGKKVLGTIQARSHPFLNEVRAWPDLSVIEVKPSNREGLPNLIKDWLNSGTTGPAW